VTAGSTLAATPKQQEIMRHVLSAADAGSFLTIRQLKERLSYGPGVSLQALQSSVRFLEKHGMIVREYQLLDSRKQVVLKPSALSYSVFRV
jgi:hypothetical protein